MRVLLTGAVLLVAGCSGSPSGLAPTQTPAPSLEDRAAAAGWLEGGDWYAQHQDILRAMETHPRVVFLGDSITQSWGGRGRAVANPGEGAWNREFAPLSALNAGISGDRTQHVLWRIDHGLFAEWTPQAVVVMIGTNNLPDDNASDIALGVRDILMRLRSLHPRPAVLLCGIPPRGRAAGSDLREKARVCNTLLADLARREDAEFFDPTALLTHGGNDADPTLMAPDYVHFTPAGYDALGAQLGPRVRELLRPGRPRTP